MATPLSQIEEHLNCSVCLGIPTNPYELTCRHTFCLECIQQIKQRSLIKCPECRKTSNYSDIQHDFKIQRLVDTLNTTEELDLNKTDEKLKCDLCKKANSPIKHKCVECAQFMCQNCTGIHKAIVMCKDHKIQSIDELISSLETNIANAMEELKDEETYISEQSSKTRKIKKEIEAEKNSQFATVDTYIDTIIEEAESHRLKLKEQIENSTCDVLDTLTTDMQAHNNNWEQLQRKRSLLTEKSNIKDLFILMEFNSIIKEEVRKEISMIRTMYPPIKDNVNSPIVIETETTRLNFEDFIWAKSSKLEELETMSPLCGIMHDTMVGNCTSSFSRFPYSDKIVEENNSDLYLCRRRSTVTPRKPMRRLHAKNNEAL